METSGRFSFAGYGGIRLFSAHKGDAVRQIDGIVPGSLIGPSCHYARRLGGAVRRNPFKAISVRPRHSRRSDIAPVSFHRGEDIYLLMRGRPCVRTGYLHLKALHRSKRISVSFRNNEARIRIFKRRYGKPDIHSFHRFRRFAKESAFSWKIPFLSANSKIVCRHGRVKLIFRRKCPSDRKSD